MTYGRRLVLALSMLALVLAYLPRAASAAAGPLTWGPPTAVDAQPPYGVGRQLRGISCVTGPLCVAVDDSGHVAASTNPTGGTSSWQVAEIPGAEIFAGISCVSGPFCAALGATVVNGTPTTVIATSTDPTGGAGAWTVQQASTISPSFKGISCASSSFCGVVDDAGHVWTGGPTDPMSWFEFTADSGDITQSISCPLASLCVITDEHGHVLWSTSPHDLNPTWTSTTIDNGSSLNSVTCDTASACWIADGAGNVLRSNGAFTNAWTSVNVDTTDNVFNSISCSASACVASDTNGNVAGTDAPSTFSSASDWKFLSVDPHQQLYSASCVPGSSTCAVVDGDSHVLTTADPFAGNWAITPVDGTSALDAVACPSLSLCVVPDSAGAVLTSTDPTGGAGAWQRSFVDSSRLSAASCPSASLCVLGDIQGRILTSTDPTGGAVAWSQPVNVTGFEVASLSCPTAALCLGVDSNGNVFDSTNPTGGAGAWSPASTDPGQSVDYVACPSASLCLAVDQAGGVLSSTNPTGGAGAWARVVADPGQVLDSVSCANTSLCVAVDDNGNAVTSTNPAAGAWSAPMVLDPTHNGFADVACRPGPVCVATDFIGNLWMSTNPAAGAWSKQDVDGTNELDAVKCSPGLLCVAVDGLGNLFVGRPPVPTSTRAPAVLGTAKVGQQLTASPAAWTGDPVTFGYRWAQCDLTGGGCAWILGASGQTYTVHPGDAGHTLRVQEFATNAGGGSLPVTSAPTQAVAPASTSAAPINTIAPQIRGAAIPGHSLRASAGNWLGSLPMGFSYQWQSCRRLCNSIAGGTRSSYRVRKRDVGARIRVVMTATNSGGHGFAVSAPTGPVLTIKQIGAIVLHAVVPHGRAAHLAAILARHGFMVSFEGLIPGELRIVWNSGRTVIATGTLSFKAAVRHKLRLKLTRVGQARLSAGTLTATVAFIPAGARKLTFSERFRLS